MHEQPLTRQDAENAKKKNIIEIALRFSAMTRVFARESDTKILEHLDKFFKQVRSVTTQSKYDALHSGFCDWFVKNISTAAKRLKNGRTIASCQCSYGHAAKVLDVAAKVYIYYCAQPSPEAAQRLVPMLHAALDTDMMHHLCRNSPPNLHGVDRAEYQRLQALVNDAIANSRIYPVQYDDLMWRHIQRRVP
jgi:hypothetical protein